MNYLLDTHALLWFLFDDPQLPQNTKDLICNSEKIYVSIASLWEITIKRSIGKLNIHYSASDIAKACNEKAISILGIKPIHLDEIMSLPSIHNDPFDRLIISQAKSEGMTLVSRDGKFSGYNIPLYWG